MMPVKEILAPYQSKVTEYVASAKHRKKEVCVHVFVTYPFLDHENDRIEDIRICKRCGYEA